MADAPEDRVKLIFINSDGHRVGEETIPYTQMADRILLWLGQQRGGEVIVSNA